MLLLILLPTQDQVTLKFGEDIADFASFEEIFKSLKNVDTLCAMYINGSSQSEREVKVVSVVSSLSKNSPFELSAFVADHWFEILLFILGSPTKVISASKTVYGDAKTLCDKIFESYGQLFDDKLEPDGKILTKIINWFSGLSQKEKARITRLMNRQKRIFVKLKRIQVWKRKGI